MTRTPDQLLIEARVLRALIALTRKDVVPWADLFEADGVQEFPYAPEGSPSRIEGKSKIAEYLAGFPEALDLHEIGEPRWHHDGDVALAEFEVQGTAVATGRPYNQRYVSIIEHRDGLISRYVDYWNPLVVQEALGGMFQQEAGAVRRRQPPGAAAPETRGSRE